MKKYSLVSRLLKEDVADETISSTAESAEEATDELVNYFQEEIDRIEAVMDKVSVNAPSLDDVKSIQRGFLEMAKGSHIVVGDNGEEAAKKFLENLAESGLAWNTNTFVANFPFADYVGAKNDLSAELNNMIDIINEFQDEIEELAAGEPKEFKDLPIDLQTTLGSRPSIRAALDSMPNTSRVTESVSGPASIFPAGYSEDSKKKCIGYAKKILEKLRNGEIEERAKIIFKRPQDFVWLSVKASGATTVNPAGTAIQGTEGNSSSAIPAKKAAFGIWIKYIVNLVRSCWWWLDTTGDEDVLESYLDGSYGSHLTQNPNDPEDTESDFDPRITYSNVAPGDSEVPEVEVTVQNTTDSQRKLRQRKGQLRTVFNDNELFATSGALDPVETVCLGVISVAIEWDNAALAASVARGRNAQNSRALLDKYYPDQCPTACRLTYGYADFSTEYKRAISSAGAIKTFVDAGANGFNQTARFTMADLYGGSAEAAAKAAYIARLRRAQEYISTNPLPMDVLEYIETQVMLPHIAAGAAKGGVSFE